MKFIEARNLAQREALDLLEEFYAGEPEDILDSQFEEAEHCWMFFRNRSIRLPEGALRNFAFVHGKHGGARTVVDLRDDPTELRRYLAMLSEYFATPRDQ